MTLLRTMLMGMALCLGVACTSGASQAPQPAAAAQTEVAADGQSCNPQLAETLGAEAGKACPSGMKCCEPNGMGGCDLCWSRNLPCP